MLGRRIKKLILLRLLVGALLLYCPPALKSQAIYYPTVYLNEYIQLSFYGVSVLICLLSVIYILW